MAIEYIKYKNKKYPVTVDYYVLMMMQKQHSTNLMAMDMDLEVYQPFLFYALERGHKAVGKENPFVLEDMIDVLGECFFDFVDLVPTFFPGIKEKEAMEELPGKAKGGPKKK